MIARRKMFLLSFLLFKDTFQFLNILRRQVFILDHGGEHGFHGTPENTSQERAALCFDKNILFNQRIIMILSPNLFVPKSPLVD